MRYATLRTLYFCEMRLLLRDRRTVVFGLLLPALVLPLFFYISSQSQEGRTERLESATYRYAVRGPASDLARQWIVLGTPEPTDDADDHPSPGFEEVEVEDPATALAARDLHFYIDAFMAPKKPAVPSPARWGWRPERELEDEEIAVPSLRLVYRGNWDPSSVAVRAMEGRLGMARALQRQDLLTEHGFPVRLAEARTAVSKDLASAERRGGAALGRFAGFFLLMMMLTGGSVVAADTLAGEKERGTLETLLTTAADRREIIAAKQFGILTVGLVICLMQVLNLIVWIGLDLFTLPADQTLALDVSTVLLMLLLGLPLAGLVASLLLLLSGRARTYREFQVYFFPLFLILLPLAAAAFLPDLPLRSSVVLVPVANVSVALREIMVGELDLPMLVLTWCVSMVAAFFASRAAWQTLDAEHLVTHNDLDQGDLRGGDLYHRRAVFPRHVLWWFAGFWAVLVLSITNLPWLANLHAQLTFNLVILFLGGSLFLIARYRLDFRQTLSLQAPKAAVWPAVLIGAPAMLLGAIAVSRVSEWLFPVPAALTEEFSQMIAPADASLIETLLLVAVLPGICEEVAFRGVLLHGLRPRFPPWVLCLVVGGVFALFHLELSRFLQTALIGAALTATTLITGSIYPAMAWHTLSNGSALLAGHFELALEELPWAAQGAGLIVAGLSLGWIWRVGRREKSL